MLRGGYAEIVEELQSLVMTRSRADSGAGLLNRGTADMWGLDNSLYSRVVSGVPGLYPQSTSQTMTTKNVSRYYQRCSGGKSSLVENYCYEYIQGREGMKQSKSQDNMISIRESGGESGAKVLTTNMNDSVSAGQQQ